MMPKFLSAGRLVFVLRRFRERLWVKPLIMCLLSSATVLSARIADSYALEKLVPGISIDSVESLLTVSVRRT